MLNNLKDLVTRDFSQKFHIYIYISKLLTFFHMQIGKKKTLKIIRNLFYVLNVKPIHWTLHTALGNQISNSQTGMHKQQQKLHKLKI